MEYIKTSGPNESRSIASTTTTKKNTTHWQYWWWFIQVKLYYNAIYSEPRCRGKKMAHSGSQCCVIRAWHSPIYSVFPHVVLMGTHKTNYRITIMQRFLASFS